LDVFVENSETNAILFQVREEERKLCRRNHNVQVSAISSWFVPEVEPWTVAEML
jgi:hypothetical protein